MKLGLTAPAVVVAIVLITGCGGDKTPDTSVGAKSPGAGQLSGGPSGGAGGSPAKPLPSPTPLPTTLPAGCGTPIKGPALPEGWPTAVPLPPNLVLTLSTESGGALRISGVTSQTLPADAAFLKQGMSTANIEMSKTTTGTTVASSDFSTAEYVGDYLLRTIPGCPGHTRLIMSVVLL
ncbi:MAG: hypothetical protein M3O55_02260 [Actinomycetota bacterium]|nr:hypothetical protein [Actinomycetota bacterium]